MDSSCFSVWFLVQKINERSAMAVVTMPGLQV